MTDVLRRPASQDWATQSAARTRRRNAAERRFQLYGLIAVGLALTCLGLLFFTIIGKAYSAFEQTMIQLEVPLDAEEIDPERTGDPSTLARADYGGFVKQAFRGLFPEVTSRGDRRALSDLVSTGAGFQLQRLVMENPSLVGTTQTIWVPASDDVDMYVKGYVAPTEGGGRISEKQAVWVDTLMEQGIVEARFNAGFFSHSDSREPELAGIWGAAVGSLLTLTVTLVLAFPVGVMAAIYLEEFAPKNRWTDLIEVNINNLAAVPSIVFGLLGLAVFLNFFGLPRSAPLVGGMVLALMTLPTIIIAGRAALKAVPPSIREAALGIGASRVQVVTHHVLPLAMPGILTGAIIGMAQALGETAPLLMIGMVAFIVDVPGSFTDAATVLPVQIFLWADSPERAFVERTSAAIVVLLAFLICMNLAAIYLRRRFERRW